MPLPLINKIGHNKIGMIPSKTTMVLNLIGNIRDTVTMLWVDVTIRSNTSNATFFVVEGKRSYNTQLE